VKTPVMVAEDEGWFEPGDNAVRYDDGLLAIEGRSSDVLNAGGMKIPAVAVEGKLTALPDVSDAALTMLPAPRSDLLAVAIVAADGAALQPLLAEVRRMLPSGLPFRLQLMREIPRNEMGKVDRQRLATSIAERIKAETPRARAHA
jgi:acyl-coenzyme A synthetase/AMP-(fatty) acid ligase